ncbi:MAG: hypothetical protein K2J61_01420 [Clostridia bacterium]|nr:hypothetical protein [Clostridia bacterium]
MKRKQTDKQFEEMLFKEIEKSDNKSLFSCRFLLKFINAILAENFSDTYILDEEGLTIAFPEGQKFLLTIKEL